MATVAGSAGFSWVFNLQGGFDCLHSMDCGITQSVLGMALKSSLKIGY
jgi:hypothetical protein